MNKSTNTPRPIKLSDLLRIDDPSQFKLHLACANEDGVHPLNEYVESREKWIGWNEWRGTRNDWSRPFILSFIDFYPLSNAYLFGGVFEVKERLPDRYVIKEIDAYSPWEGRLVCRFHRYQGMRGRAFLLEKQFDAFEVLQVLPERYAGERFPGYGCVNHSFSNLKPIVEREKPDWKAAFEAVKGVYLVMDSGNGKAYVGSAYGNSGIWSRLRCYLETGHGWNDALVSVIMEKGIDYALAHFRFSILEVFAFNTPDDTIFDREAHWKNVLLSRRHGYNWN